MGLAVAPSSPNIIYALIEAKKNALYKSIDGGFNWKKINDRNEIGNRPFYYSDVRVDPKRPNILFSISGRLSRSIDSGSTWERIATTVHGDHQSLWIDPENPEVTISSIDVMPFVAIGALKVAKAARDDQWIRP